VSQELPDPNESARIAFDKAVLRWQEAGASREQIELELEYVLEDDIGENTSRPIPAENFISGKAAYEKKLISLVFNYFKDKKIVYKDGNPHNYDITNIEVVRNE
jgi:hypothetical protein